MGAGPVRGLRTSPKRLKRRRMPAESLVQDPTISQPMTARIMAGTAMTWIISRMKAISHSMTVNSSYLDTPRVTKLLHRGMGRALEGVKTHSAQKTWTLTVIDIAVQMMIMEITMSRQRCKDTNYVQLRSLLKENQRDYIYKWCQRGCASSVHFHGTTTNFDG